MIGMFPEPLVGGAVAHGVGVKSRRQSSVGGEAGEVDVDGFETLGGAGPDFAEERTGGDSVAALRQAGEGVPFGLGGDGSVSAFEGEVAGPGVDDVGFGPGQPFEPGSVTAAAPAEQGAAGTIEQAMVPADGEPIEGLGVFEFDQRGRGEGGVAGEEGEVGS